MEYDHAALERKTREIRELVKEAAHSSPAAAGDAVEQIMGSFVRLTAPTEPERTIEMITMRPSGRGGGRSRKPGNIYLNWRKLMDLLPDIAIAAVGGTASPPWFLPVIGLYVWNKLWCSSAEELSEADATTLYALWKNRRGDSKISEDDGFEKTNAGRKACGLEPLTRGEYDRVINRLLKMDTIEMEEGMIWLRESVRMAY